MPFTCANCGLDAPKTDFTYFFTSFAVSTNPVLLEYYVSFFAILVLMVLG